MKTEIKLRKEKQMENRLHKEEKNGYFYSKKIIIWGLCDQHMG